MSEPRPTVLIVEACYYDEIASHLADSVIAVLDAAGFDHERVTVPGVFEVPAAVMIGMLSGRYIGAVALGCVIRGETDHYDHICRESSRALMELSMEGVALGYGILTCETYEQALVRADVAGKNKGAEVAAAVLRMIELKDQFSDFDDMYNDQGEQEQAE
jgi:6,7-dimethyl-8-ribityllumazine synthase